MYAITHIVLATATILVLQPHGQKRCSPNLIRRNQAQRIARQQAPDSTVYTPGKEHKTLRINTNAFL